ncbi:DNA-binding protein [Tessaracoccus rhinocerotis]|uniref:DNA-binding protein n=1 Tax=Tessaracoccus rhinocerotis TaxID=1689449 RepID=A0A553K411_9ACTN|nr:DNA-binding protein [Tessaracoccus rhinocerotis]
MQDAARYVSCHPRTITRRFGDGTLSRYRLGRKVIVDLDELDAALCATSFRMPLEAGR